MEATLKDGQVYSIAGGEMTAVSLAEVATLLGVEAVTAEDISEGGKYADLVEVVDAVAEESDEEFEDTAKLRTTPADDEVPSAEAVLDSLPEFADHEEVKEFVKDLDTNTLEHITKALGAEWEPCPANASIERMRIAMAFKGHFFPETLPTKKAGGKKKPAKYGDFSTESLAKLAKDNGVKHRVTGQDAIDRMNLIQALKSAGIDPSQANK